MGYTPPRPTLDGPAHISSEAVTRHLRGDAISGEVADWIYVSSDKFHQLIFGLLPGTMFRHSEEYRTIFGADEVLYVLNGVLARIPFATTRSAPTTCWGRARGWRAAGGLCVEQLRARPLRAGQRPVHAPGAANRRAQPTTRRGQLWPSPNILTAA